MRSSLRFANRKTPPNDIDPLDSIRSESLSISGVFIVIGKECAEGLPSSEVENLR